MADATQSAHAAETYTLGQTGLIVRDSDGARIPVDPENADYRAYAAWAAAGGVASAPPKPPFNPDAVKAECQRRIYAVASANCQINMTAFVAGGAANADATAAFNAGLRWIADMRAACSAHIAARDESFAQDDRWPACPDSARALAAQF